MRHIVFALSLATAGSASAQESFDCVMDPAEVIDLSSAVPGVLTEVAVTRGTRVSTGDVIARLESSVENATLAVIATRAGNRVAIEAQQARRDLIETQRERIATLVDRNVASAEQLEVIEAELVSATALLAQAELDYVVAGQELERARQQIEQRIVRSPVDGIVTAQILQGGEFVPTNGVIVRIVRLDPLIIESFLPVEMFPQVRVGQIAQVAPASPFDGSFPATVTAIDRVFDAASGTFGIALELANADRSLPAGHRCLLSFPSEG